MTAPNSTAGCWDEAFAAYQRLRILRDADAAFGALAEATYNREIAIQQAETRCGSRREALAQRDVKTANRALCAAEERHHAMYGDPMEAAAIATVLAPAPDLEAVETKIALIQLFELDNSTAMPRPPMEIIAEDIDRLSSSPHDRGDVFAAWSAARAVFDAARTSELEYDATVWRPANVAAQAGGGVISPGIDSKMDRLLYERIAAEDTLIETAAPDLAAIVWKIRYARERWSDFTDFPEDWWAAIMADLERLSGAGRTLLATGNAP